MRSLSFRWAATFLLPGVAFAAEPTGEWRVANGAAFIRIDDCGGTLWGVVSWEKQPGVDSQNPNPGERGRPTLGLPILKAMRPTKPGVWEGEVYNAENGKTYSSRISLTAPDVLRIEGCVFGGLFCGGENWTRVKTVDTTPAPPAAPAGPAASPRPGVAAPAPATRATRPGPAAPTPPAPAPTLSACSGIPDGAGAAHKGGLK